MTEAVAQNRPPGMRRLVLTLTCIPALYGQRSKCADLPEGFDTFIVIRKETVNEWEDKRIAER